MSMNPRDPTRTTTPQRSGTPGPATGSVQTHSEPNGRYVERDVNTRTWNEADNRLRDRIRWGAIWAGIVVAVATYLFLQVLLIALDIVDVRGGDSTDAAWSAIAALVAFLL